MTRDPYEPKTLVQSSRELVERVRQQIVRSREAVDQCKATVAMLHLQLDRKVIKHAREQAHDLQRRLKEPRLTPPPNADVADSGTIPVVQTRLSVPLSLPGDCQPRGPER